MWFECNVLHMRIRSYINHKRKVYQAAGNCPGEDVICENEFMFSELTMNKQNWMPFDVVYIFYLLLNVLRTD